MRPRTRSMLFRICALCLLILAASPFTFPFGTCDLVPAVHEGTTVSGAKVKLQETALTAALWSASCTELADGLPDASSRLGLVIALRPPPSLVLRL